MNVIVGLLCENYANREDFARWSSFGCGMNSALRTVSFVRMCQRGDLMTVSPALDFHN